MVADDDAGILEATSMFLELKGYRVSQVARGDVFAACLKAQPDFLLLDIWMSGTDGREVCRKLKSDVKTKSIPVVLFSAGNDVETSSLAAGADGFLEKPFDIADLLAVVKEHLPAFHT